MKIQEQLDNCRHLSIQLHNETLSLIRALTDVARTKEFDELISFDLIRDILYLSSILEGIALDTRDLFLALGKFGMSKLGNSLVKDILKDVMKPELGKEMLKCSCLKCNSLKGSNLN